jgi:hypothetical protein
LTEPGRTEEKQHLSVDYRLLEGMREYNPHDYAEFKRYNDMIANPENMNLE